MGIVYRIMAHSNSDKIIEEVRKSYNAVASPFARSRARDWSEFALFLPSIQGSILDAGCAHGRLVPFLQSHNMPLDNYIGIDISDELIAKAKSLYPALHFEQGNLTTIPYADECFDTVICSAVLHHIPEDKRMRVLNELLRVTKKGGTCMLLVWNAFYFKHLWKNIFMSYVRAIFSFGKNRAGDMYLPFFSKTVTRYVHAFTERELRTLLHKTGYKFTLQNTGKNFFIKISK